MKFADFVEILFGDISELVADEAAKIEIVETGLVCITVDEITSDKIIKLHENYGQFQISESEHGIEMYLDIKEELK